jgi:hypothetical protein
MNHAEGSQYVAATRLSFAHLSDFYLVLVVHPKLGKEKLQLSNLWTKILST